ncbi:MAG TPA: LysR substrate-binding domain-containing protein, partial [Bryobacteraceae bacterium]|nr:LysR substrate-binding domain-containing protein [Bryobacteraceae bacterium]
KALEEGLGLQLFDRTGGRVTLTRAGETLLGFAARIDQLLLEADTALSLVRGEYSGNLIVGASLTIAQYLLPRLLGAFAQLYPGIQLSAISRNTEQIVEALIERRVAVGMIEGPPLKREIQVEPFFDDELVLIVPAAHEWAERGVATAEELAGSPLILREQGSGSRKVAEIALRKIGLPPKRLRILFEFDSTEAIISAVEAGLGVGFVSKLAVGKEIRLQTLRTVAVERLSMQRAFCLAYVKGAEHEPAVDKFLHFARQAPSFLQMRH